MWKNRKRLPAQVWDGPEGFVDECAQMMAQPPARGAQWRGPLLPTGHAACV